MSNNEALFILFVYLMVALTPLVYLVLTGGFK